MTPHEIVESRIAKSPADADNILMDLIITCDGQGKEVKRVAVEVLLAVARSEAVTKERARFRAQFIQEEA